MIGVTEPRTAAFGNPDTLYVWIPYTTAMNRVLGQNYLQRITVRVADSRITSYNVCYTKLLRAAIRSR